MKGSDATSKPAKLLSPLHVFLRGLLIGPLLLAPALFVTWWRAPNEPFKLYMYGQIVTTIILWATFLAVRKRRLAADSGQPGNVNRQFSLTEALILMTWLCLTFGLGSAQSASDQRVFRELQAIEAEAEAILGVGGDLNFNSEGWSIIICDRTFDDQHLARVSALLTNHGIMSKVCFLMFGSNAATNGTPAEWPGITDASVPVLLGFRNVRQLWIDGTAISPEGLKQLAELPRLENALVS